MQKITARQLLGLSLTEVWGLPKEGVEVTYEDGKTVQVKQRLAIFDRYIWELFLIHPNTPIHQHCTTTSVIGEGYFNGGTHSKTFERVFGFILTHNGIKNHADKIPLLKCIQHVIDLIHNDILTRASADVFTIDATDFVQVINSDVISKMHANLKPTPEGVEGAYKEIKQYVNSGGNGNRFINAYRAKATDENQSNQLIGPRGFGTDKDRTVFRVPVMNGFIRGMGNLYELMVESCTAAKALNATSALIEQPQYASRRIQLLTMIVNGVVTGDCGSKDYLPITVNEQNLDSLKGKYYLNSEGGLSVITGECKHLLGELISMRSVLGCKHHDSTKVCMTCLGDVGGNFPTNTNLGFTAATHLLEKITSAVLATKHLTHSVRKSFIKLEGIANQYLYSNENGDLFFRADVNLKDLTLILPNAKVGKLVDVLNLPHTNIGLSKIGELDTVYIKNMASKTPKSETLNISYKDRNSVLTKYLLEYIKGCDLESDSRGNFMIPLGKIDKTKPIFNNPLKEANVINFVHRIAGLIETNKDKVTDPVEKLALLFSITQEKFKCNIFVLEILIYATTAYNAAAGNYRLGRGSPTPYTEGKSVLFRNRCFGALSAFEDQMKELRKHPVEIFTNHCKQNHPMAIFFTPQQVVDEINR